MAHDAVRRRNVMAVTAVTASSRARWNARQSALTGTHYRRCCAGRLLRLGRVSSAGGADRAEHSTAEKSIAISAEHHSVPVLCSLCSLGTDYSAS